MADSQVSHALSHLEAVDERHERLAHGDADVVTAVVEPLEQVGAHVVQLVLLDASAQQPEHVTQHAHRHQARVLVVVLHGRAHLRQ